MATRGVAAWSRGNAEPCAVPRDYTHPPVPPMLLIEFAARATPNSCPRCTHLLLTHARRLSSPRQHTPRRVSRGFEVVKEIEAAKTVGKNDKPLEDIKIMSVDVKQ